MTLQLFNRQTARLAGWNRGDEEIPVGLDRDAFHVVEVIQLEPPEPGPGQIVRPTEPVVVISDPDSEGINGTTTLAWVVEDVPEPELEPQVPDWNQFALEIFGGALKTGFNSLCAQLTQAGQLPLVLALSTQISVIQTTGHYQLFAGIWQQCLPHLNISPEIGGALLQKAHECKLPGDFIAALIPEQS